MALVLEPERGVGAFMFPGFRVEGFSSRVSGLIVFGFMVLGCEGLGFRWF